MVLISWPTKTIRYSCFSCHLIKDIEHEHAELLWVLVCKKTQCLFTLLHRLCKKICKMVHNLIALSCCCCRRKIPDNEHWTRQWTHDSTLVIYSGIHLLQNVQCNINFIINQEKDVSFACLNFWHDLVKDTQANWPLFFFLIFFLVFWKFICLCLFIFIKFMEWK